MLTVGSLFSGIGGFDLGLEQAGMRTAWFCEQDDFCRRVLAKHWPDIPCYEDVRELAGADVAPVDVLCGGFPCQDISGAGKRVGIDGARSGLWSEYARLVGELRPRYVVVENVSDLLVRGFGRVLGDLAALGYDAEWDCIPASAVGAPHQRDRVWIVAYPGGERSVADSGGERGSVRRAAGDLVEAAGGGQGAREERQWNGDAVDDRRADVADIVADTEGERRGALRATYPQAGTDAGLVDAGWWSSEPDVGRVADGVPARVDRLRSLGNALVPQIAEWIGRRIIEWEEAQCLTSK